MCAFKITHYPSSSYPVRSHKIMFGFKNIDTKTLKKIFIISAISFFIILFVGGYLSTIYPNLLPFQIPYKISSIAVSIIFFDSVYALTKYLFSEYFYFPLRTYLNI